MWWYRGVDGLRLPSADSVRWCYTTFQHRIYLLPSCLEGKPCWTTERRRIGACPVDPGSVLVSWVGGPCHAVWPSFPGSLVAGGMQDPRWHEACETGEGR